MSDSGTGAVVAAEEKAPSAPASSSPPAWKVWLQQGLAFGTLLVLILFFWAASPRFLTWSIISVILLATAVTGILALGTTFVITTAGIELSFGTGMTLCSVMTGIFAVNLGLPLIVGVVLGILMGVFIALINGLHGA